MSNELCNLDLLIIGGGPAGLSAAINAASEGLRVAILDSAPIMGGQARESNAIENYLGFPDGITGEALMSSAIMQARKFGNITFICPASAVGIARNEDTGLITVTTEDYQEIIARAVLLSNGLTYRRLNATNIGSIMGRGVYYGAPMSAMPTGKKCSIAIVGGANSAGQAAVKLAENHQAKIKMFIRKRLDTQMSHYLVDRIEKAPNIEVCEGCEITAVDGDKWLKNITYTQGDEKGMKTEDMHYMFIFIGAMPRTSWLRPYIQLDEGNYILTGTQAVVPELDNGGFLPPMFDVSTSNDALRSVVNPSRVPLFYETSMMGVFAAGDVRAGSTKRIATAIGEGSAVVGMIHQYIALSK